MSRCRLSPTFFLRDYFGSCCGLPGTTFSVSRAADGGNGEGLVAERGPLLTAHACKAKTTFTEKNEITALNAPFGCVAQAAKELTERKAMVARERKERQAKEIAHAKR